MEKARILIAEDEKNQRDLLEGFLKKEGFSVEAVANGREALQELEGNFFDVALIDYKMPELDGLQTLREIRNLYPDLPVVMMTAYGTVETAVASMKEGALDYLTKPIDLDELLLMLQKVIERSTLIRENKELRAQLQERYKFTHIVYGSPKMEEVMGLVARVAPSQTTVLIRGESGTGKELVANAIHYASPRSEKPWIKVSCAAIPETLLESELFGHERGAFTGATNRRIGRFEEADGGSIFLDEIGDLSPSTQVKLLRILQDKEFQRLGSNQSLKTDVRVITATHRNLEEAIQKGLFREDLYYRLNVISIVLPLLRERREDISLLIDYFLKKYSEENQKSISDISKEARSLLLRYPYPGNVRELENLIERAVVLCRGELITTQDLPFHLKEEKSEKLWESSKKEKSLPESLEEIEKDSILNALHQHQGVQTKAAERLGISERVLRYKMKKYRIRLHPPSLPLAKEQLEE
ncbi:MAG: two-component system response regulator [Deltaproteobacteria bacterium RBG_16_47_11]|nr:MAG: two-component system response regulator [Deltaproteobacteria bacterium RBG_16_47_11]